jgi:hypothetical protein
MPNSTDTAAQVAAEPRLPQSVARRVEGRGSIVQIAEQDANRCRTLKRPWPWMHKLAFDKSDSFTPLVVKSRAYDSGCSGKANTLKMA